MPGRCGQKKAWNAQPGWEARIRDAGTAHQLRSQKAEVRKKSVNLQRPSFNDMTTLNQDLIAYAAIAIGAL
jgi:hypothetical protein